MKLTCAQMDVLISFYIDGELSSSLKAQVEEHMKSCGTCRAKYDIIKSMLTDLKNVFEPEELPCEQLESFANKSTSQQYRLFKDNLSAYIDNELPDEENLRIKKFTINNPDARRELQDNYNIKRMMKDSFDKSKTDSKQDFSRSVLKQLELEEEVSLGFHPAIKLLIAFTISVLVVTSLVLVSLSV